MTQLEKKILERIIKRMDPKYIASGLCRAEADHYPEERKFYRKGAKSMLQNFVEDTDFVERVMEEFDNIYKGF